MLTSNSYSFAASLFLLISVFSSALCFSSGPPTDDNMCTSMLPGHGVPPQSNIGISVNLEIPSLCYWPGQSVKITVSNVRKGNAVLKIEGLMLMMKKPNVDNDAQGSISYSGNLPLKTSACFRKSDSALHHYEEADIYTFTFTWTPPQSLSGVIDMTMTLLTSYRTYYVGVRKAIPQCVVSPDNNNNNNNNNNNTNNNNNNNVTPSTNNNNNAFTESDDVDRINAFTVTDSDDSDDHRNTGMSPLPPGASNSVDSSGSNDDSSAGDDSSASEDRR